MLATEHGHRIRVAVQRNRFHFPHPIHAFHLVIGISKNQRQCLSDPIHTPDTAWMVKKKSEVIHTHHHLHHMTPAGTPKIDKSNKTFLIGLAKST